MCSDRSEEETTQILAELLKGGANVNAIRRRESVAQGGSVSSKTPLDLALKKGQWKVAEELCKYGASLSGQKFTLSSTHKWPILHTAGKLTFAF